MEILGYLYHRLLFAISGSSQTKRTLRKLGSSNDQTAQALKEVVYNLREREYSEQEKARTNSIERLRKKLLSDSAQVSITDFGAGSKNYSVSDDEMKSGKIVYRRVREICRTSAKSKKWCLLLFNLVRKFRPNICLELGTSLGISTAYLAAACELNEKGKVITLEGAASLVSLAQTNLTSLKLSRFEIIQGRFQDSLPEVLQKNSLIDFVFIDGHHDKKATLMYLEQLLPYLNDKALVIFDDISWSSGMREAWSAIKKHNNLFYAIDLFDMGVCVFTKH